MGRIVKSPDVRQNEILDAAQQLFYTKGYENTAVQDVINKIGIAKGTFYYHFNSKEAVLDALINRLLDQATTILESILADDQPTALEKLHLFFGAVGNLKLENETFVRTLLPIWYADSNMLLREKTKRMTFDIYVPFFNQIIQQGIDEGVFHVQFPDEIGGIIFQTMYFMSDTLARLLLDTENSLSWEIIQHKTNAYNATMDKLLGAEPGSIHLYNFEPFRHWFE